MGRKIQFHFLKHIMLGNTRFLQRPFRGPIVVIQKKVAVTDGTEVNFDSFSQFLQIWLNLSAPTYQSGLQFGRPDFLAPLAPLGARQ